MTSKERMLIALNREKPDRLPVTVHQWQSYHLHKYLAGISDLEAFEKFGLDAQIQHLGEVGQTQDGTATSKTSTKDWQVMAQVISDSPDKRLVDYTITTPEGRLTFQTEGNQKTTWISGYLVKQDEDIELIRKYLPVPKLNKKVVNELYDRVGERGILRGFVWGEQAGCWQHACCLMDVHNLILCCFDKPDWVHRFLGILLEKKLQFIESMKGARFDLIEAGGGAASSTLISPNLHQEFCLPYDRKLHDALHNLGFKLAYHTCGGTLGIEEMIVANGCDVSETLAPKSIGGNQEPWEFAAKIRGRLSLIGGLDQCSVLTDGTKEEIRSKVHELFEKVGRNGGYICSLSDHFFETPLENIQAYADAARECVY
jgi:uroporphyrinogen-III decarboxylase